MAAISRDSDNSSSSTSESAASPPAKLRPVLTLIGGNMVLGANGKYSSERTLAYYLSSAKGKDSPRATAVSYEPVLGVRGVYPVLMRAYLLRCVEFGDVTVRVDEDHALDYIQSLGGGVGGIDFNVVRASRVLQSFEDCDYNPGYLVAMAHSKGLLIYASQLVVSDGVAQPHESGEGESMVDRLDFPEFHKCVGTHLCDVVDQLRKVRSSPVGGSFQEGKDWIGKCLIGRITFESHIDSEMANSANMTSKFEAMVREISAAVNNMIRAHTLIVPEQHGVVVLIRRLLALLKDSSVGTRDYVNAANCILWAYSYCVGYMEATRSIGYPGEKGKARTFGLDIGALSDGRSAGCACMNTDYKKMVAYNKYIVCMKEIEVQVSGAICHISRESNAMRACAIAEGDARIANGNDWDRDVFIEEELEANMAVLRDVNWVFGADGKLFDGPR